MHTKSPFPNNVYFLVQLANTFSATTAIGQYVTIMHQKYPPNQKKEEKAMEEEENKGDIVEVVVMHTTSGHFLYSRLKKVAVTHQTYLQTAK